MANDDNKKEGLIWTPPGIGPLGQAVDPEPEARVDVKAEASVPPVRLFMTRESPEYEAMDDAFWAVIGYLRNEIKLLVKAAKGTSDPQKMWLPELKEGAAKFKRLADKFEAAHEAFNQNPASIIGAGFARDQVPRGRKDDVS